MSAPPLKCPPANGDTQGLKSPCSSIPDEPTAASLSCTPQQEQLASVKAVMIRRLLQPCGRFLPPAHPVALRRRQRCRAPGRTAASSAQSSRSAAACLLERMQNCCKCFRHRHWRFCARVAAVSQAESVGVRHVKLEGRSCTCQEQPPLRGGRHPARAARMSSHVTKQTNRGLTSTGTGGAVLTLEAVWYERPASPSLHGPVIIDEGSSATTVSYIACSISAVPAPEGKRSKQPAMLCLSSSQTVPRRGGCATMAWENLLPACTTEGEQLGGSSAH